MNGVVAAFLAGGGAEFVFGGEAGALAADGEVPGKEILVVGVLGKLVEFLEDALLGDGQDFDGAAVVGVDGDRDAETEVGVARVVGAGGEVTQLGADVLRGGLVVETEGLLLAVCGLAPALEVFEGLVGEECEADGAAVLDFGGVQIAASGGRDSGCSGFGKESHGMWLRGRVRPEGP